MRGFGGSRSAATLATIVYDPCRHRPSARPSAPARRLRARVVRIVAELTVSIGSMPRRVAPHRHVEPGRPCAPDSVIRTALDTTIVTRGERDVDAKAAHARDRAAPTAPNTIASSSTSHSKITAQDAGRPAPSPPPPKPEGPGQIHVGYANHAHDAPRSAPATRCSPIRKWRIAASMARANMATMSTSALADQRLTGS